MVDTDAIPQCPTCGADVGTYFAEWTTLHCDAPSATFYSDAAGRTFENQREQDQHMKKLGYRPAGDPVGGARNDTRPKRFASVGLGGGCRSTSERDYGRDHPH